MPLPFFARKIRLFGRFARSARSIAAVAIAALLYASLAGPSRAQVLFQTFTYPASTPPAGVSWWTQASTELPRLAHLCIYAVWNPVPVKGGSGAKSMGYDPYDLYDLGSKDQKGTIATRFGTKDDYLRYIAVAHANGLRVYSDVVINHTGGADGVQVNPLMEQLGMNDVKDLSKIKPEYLPAGYDPKTMTVRSWTLFLPKGADGKPGTGRFPRDLRHFHPSAVHPDRDPPYDNPEFAQDYCYEAENGYVENGLIDWGRWFRAQTGVDGFRMDAVKLMPPTFVDAFSHAVGDNAAPSTGEPFFFVGEFWDTNHDLLACYQDATHQRMSLFDFGLFYALSDMTGKPGAFTMKDLLKKRNVDRAHTVTFVSNHDVDRSQPIDRHKRALAYAIILSMSGQPSVFYKDYFQPEDAALPVTLERLIKVHNRFAVGREIVRYADESVLVIEREKNLLACFNSGGKDGLARTVNVGTGFGPGVALKAVGVPDGEPSAAAAQVTTDAKGRATVVIPSGGYVLLARADATEATNPDRFALRPLPTTQVWEFADDLDTGRLGDTARTVNVALAAGSPLTATLSGTDSAGGSGMDVTLELRNPAGAVVAAGTGHRGGAPLIIHLNRADYGVYRVMVHAPGPATAGKLLVTYTAPTQ